MKEEERIASAKEKQTTVKSYCLYILKLEDVSYYSVKQHLQFGQL